MFIGVYLIMVFDPQILFNDGFYPLLRVVISGDEMTGQLSLYCNPPSAYRPYYLHCSGEAIRLICGGTSISPKL